MKRKLVALLLLLLAATGVFLGIRHWRAPARDSQGPLTLYGHVDIRDAQLAFFETEQIAAVLAEEGDAVAPGQVLARLRTARLEAQIAEAEQSRTAQAETLRRLENGTRPQELEQARAAVEAARARLVNSRLRAARLGRTARAGASSQQDLDNAQAQMDVDQAELRRAQETLDLALEGPREEDIAQARAVLAALEANLALLRLRLADTQLVAPARGIVQSRLLEPGEVAGPTRPVLSLALTERKWVRAYVPEPDLGRVAEGRTARVFGDTFPGKAYPGTVGFISPTAEFTPKNVETTDLRTQLVYEVRVDVADPGNELRLGMPVTVEVDHLPEAAAPGTPNP